MFLLQRVRPSTERQCFGRFNTDVLSPQHSNRLTPHVLLRTHVDIVGAFEKIARLSHKQARPGRAHVQRQIRRDPVDLLK
jgi:hypothetical protein